jgi:metal-responsive CopG/Arc/MetJ family transcriptional regulator
VYFGAMRVTFSIPDLLAKKFQSVIPSRRRSQLISKLLSDELQKHEKSLEAACISANNDTILNKEIDEWQSFDEEILE